MRENLSVIAGLALSAVLSTAIYLTTRFNGLAGEVSPTYNVFGIVLVVAASLVSLLVYVALLAIRGENEPTKAVLEFIRKNASRVVFSLAALQLLAITQTMFQPMKSAIPNIVPFYTDHALAALDRALLGRDAWQLLPGAVPYLDTIYTAWVPTQLAFLSALTLAKPSTGRDIALLSYVVIWIVVGIGLATALSSVGPIFYDQAYGETRFSGLAALIEGTRTAQAAGYLSATENGLGGGISAMPSLHIAITVWMLLTCRAVWPFLVKPAALYLVLIYAGSFILGWHYITDGIIGALSAWAVWAVVAARRTGPLMSGDRLAASGSLPA